MEIDKNLNQTSKEVEELTPPNNRTHIPSFGVSYAIPLPFIAHHARNVNEILLLVEIGHIGDQLDYLISELLRELKEDEDLENAWEMLRKSLEVEATSIIPIIERALSYHLQNITTTTSDITSLYEKLVKMKESLTQYMETNKSICEELKSEGCEQLAKGKSLLAIVEELLIKKMVSSPYRSFNTTWDSFINQEKEKLEKENEEEAPITQLKPKIAKTQKISIQNLFNELVPSTIHKQTNKSQNASPQSLKRKPQENLQEKKQWKKVKEEQEVSPDNFEDIEFLGDEELSQESPFAVSPLSPNMEKEK